MYSRNLAKNTVRASPSYTASPKYSDLLYAQRSAADENRYRYNIPPGYDGNRFSRNQPSEDTDTKRHPVPRKDPEPDWQALPEAVDAAEESSEDKEVSVVEANRTPPEPHPVPADPLGSFISAVKDRVTGEDLLLVVIILMLALEGENAEITILLLSLLLLIK